MVPKMLQMDANGYATLAAEHRFAMFLRTQNDLTHTPGPRVTSLGWHTWVAKVPAKNLLGFTNR